MGVRKFDKKVQHLKYYVLIKEWLGCDKWIKVVTIVCLENVANVLEELLYVSSINIARQFLRLK
jgi:hypothetical protein